MSFVVTTAIFPRTSVGVVTPVACFPSRRTLLVRRHRKTISTVRPRCFALVYKQGEQ
jgi:hypothetical protein